MTRGNSHLAAPSLSAAEVGERAVRDCYVHAPHDRADDWDVRRHSVADPKPSNGKTVVDHAARSVGAAIVDACDFQDEDEDDATSLDRETYEMLMNGRKW